MILFFLLQTDDKNNGGITLERFKELVTEFFTSLDANTPSRNIFGPLDPNMADEILARAAQTWWNLKPPKLIFVWFYISFYYAVTLVASVITD